MLVVDEHDRVLLVKPTYGSAWNLPGGVVESAEPLAIVGSCGPECCSSGALAARAAGPDANARVPVAS